MPTFSITLIPHAVVRNWPGSPAPMPPAVHALGSAYLDVELPLKESLERMVNQTEVSVDIKAAVMNAIIRLSGQLPTGYNFQLATDSMYIPILDPVTGKVIGHFVDTMVTENGELVDRTVPYPTLGSREYGCYLCVSFVAQLL